MVLLQLHPAETVPTHTPATDKANLILRLQHVRCIWEILLSPVTVVQTAWNQHVVSLKANA